MQEKWENIVGYEGLYQVSNYGKIKRLMFRNNKYKINKEKILNLKTTKNYKFINLVNKFGVGKQYYIHRLVAETFLNRQDFKSMPDEDRALIDLSKLEVNHKDENKQNNMVDNLEWCTHKYNMNYNNLNKRISEINCKKINQISKNGIVIKTWNSISDAQKELHINNISMCCQNKKNYKTAGGFVWRYINE